MLRLAVDKHFRSTCLPNHA